MTALYAFLALIGLLFGKLGWDLHKLNQTLHHQTEEEEGPLAQVLPFRSTPPRNEEERRPVA